MLDHVRTEELVGELIDRSDERGGDRAEAQEEERGAPEGPGPARDTGATGAREVDRRCGGEADAESYRRMSESAMTAMKSSARYASEKT